MYLHIHINIFIIITFSLSIPPLMDVQLVLVGVVRVAPGVRPVGSDQTLVQQPQYLSSGFKRIQIQNSNYKREFI